MRCLHTKVQSALRPRITQSMRGQTGNLQHVTGRMCHSNRQICGSVARGRCLHIFTGTWDSLAEGVLLCRAFGQKIHGDISVVTIQQNLSQPPSHD